MSTAPFERAAAAARRVLEGVDPGQLGDPTPCQSWDVAGLINHIVGGAQFFAAGARQQPPSGDETDFAAGDFVAAFDDAAKEVVDAFSADGVMESTLTLPFGEMPGSAFLGLASTDTFTHAWDLAKATGQSTDLDPELAAQLLEQSKASIQDGFRGPEGAPFGPEQQAPDGATNADQLAAFLGRQP